MIGTVFLAFALSLVGDALNYQEIKTLARRADRARGEERKRLVERLIRELPRLDPFEGISEETIWFARFLVRMKWFDFGGFN